MLAKHDRTFSALHRRNNVTNFPEVYRDDSSTFNTKRTNATVSTTLKVTTTHSVGNDSRTIITIINSTTVAGNVSLRTLGGALSSAGHVVLVLGSGGVSVDRGINTLSHRFKHLLSSHECGGVRATVRGFTGGVHLR